MSVQPLFEQFPLPGSLVVIYFPMFFNKLLRTKALSHCICWPMIARDAKAPNLSSANPSAKVQSPALLGADLLSLGKDTDRAILSTICVIWGNQATLEKGRSA